MSRGQSRWGDNEQNVNAVKGNIGPKRSFSVKKDGETARAGLCHMLLEILIKNTIMPMLLTQEVQKILCFLKCSTVTNRLFIIEFDLSNSDHKTYSGYISAFWEAERFIGPATPRKYQ